MPSADMAHFRSAGGRQRLARGLGSVLRCEGLRLFRRQGRFDIHVHGKTRLGGVGCAGEGQGSIWIRSRVAHAEAFTKKWALLTGSTYESYLLAVGIHLE